MWNHLKPIFRWIGVTLLALAVWIALFGTGREADMIRAVALSVAALGFFKVSEFFTGKEK